MTQLSVDTYELQFLLKFNLMKHIKMGLLGK